MSASEAPGRQRLSPAVRIDAILAAATDAFATSPYDQVSVAAIGRAAGASEALVYKYFDGKTGLYAAVVKAQLEQLTQCQRAAIDELPVNSSARDLVRVIIEATLDHVASAPASASPFFSGDQEPDQVAELRLRFRAQLADDLLARVRNPDWTRGRIAIIGFLGFLGAAAQHWASAGCPGELRSPLVDAALGALQGAMGDWALLQPPDQASS
jgi:AcrR family transcriptional regulator